MIAQWILFIVSGGIPEFQTEPWRIALHLAAELTAALVLIVSGVATLANRTVTYGYAIASAVVRPIQK
jgi:hypothetical protein